MFSLYRSGRCCYCKEFLSESEISQRCENNHYSIEYLRHAIFFDFNGTLKPYIGAHMDDVDKNAFSYTDLLNNFPELNADDLDVDLDNLADRIIKLKSFS